MKGDAQRARPCPAMARRSVPPFPDPTPPMTTPDHRAPTHRAPRLPPRIPRRRRAVKPRPPAAHRVSAEAPAPAGLRRRDGAHRLGIVVADTAAALLVAGLAMTWAPSRELAATVFGLPLLLPLIAWANGLYQRDEQLLNKSTLDEAPTLFRAATLTAVVGYLLASWALTEPIGAKAVGFVWLGLTLAMPACAASPARRAGAGCPRSAASWSATTPRATGSRTSSWARRG